MSRPALEVADIFRAHGPAWRDAQAGRLSLGQLKVMSAIEQCRSAVLGGHLLQCRACKHMQIAYNSCRNRHCPKCQSSAARRWLEARQAELLPVEYYHLVFTLPHDLNGWAALHPEALYALEGGIGAVYGRLSGCRFEDNSAYGAFAATISPCSVSRIDRSTEPGGWARIAW